MASSDPPPVLPKSAGKVLGRLKKRKLGPQPPAEVAGSGGVDQSAQGEMIELARSESVLALEASNVSGSAVPRADPLPSAEGPEPSAPIGSEDPVGPREDPAPLLDSAEPPDSAVPNLPPSPPARDEPGPSSVDPAAPRRGGRVLRDPPPPLESPKRLSPQWDLTTHDSLFLPSKAREVFHHLLQPGTEAILEGATTFLESLDEVSACLLEGGLRVANLRHRYVPEAQAMLQEMLDETSAAKLSWAEKMAELEKERDEALKLAESRLEEIGRQAGAREGFERGLRETAEARVRSEWRLGYQSAIVDAQRLNPLLDLSELRSRVRPPSPQ